jgi:hypothetical protein
MRKLLLIALLFGSAARASEWIPVDFHSDALYWVDRDSVYDRLLYRYAWTKFHDATGHPSDGESLLRFDCRTRTVALMAMRFYDGADASKPFQWEHAKNEAIEPDTIMDVTRRAVCGFRSARRVAR